MMSAIKNTIKYLFMGKYYLTSWYDGDYKTISHQAIKIYVDKFLVPSLFGVVEDQDWAEK